MSGRDGIPFWGLTAQQIYDQLTGGPGSGRLNDAGSAASQEWQREEERAHDIRALATDMKSGWDGRASDAAHGAAGPLAESALQGAGQLHTSEQLLNQQSEIFHSAANSVVPVPEKPPESTILNYMIPWETDLDQEIQAYQADAQHNVEVFRGYDTTSLDHETPLAREYATVTHSGGDISVRGSGDTIGSDGHRGGGDPGSYSAPSGSDSGGDPGGSTGGSPAGGSQASDDVRPGDTQASQVSPSATPGSGLQNVAPPLSQPGPTTGTLGGGLIGAGPLVGATPTGSGAGSGTGGRTGGVGSGGGLGGRGGVAGGAPGMRGGAPGPGAGALAAEQVAQRGGPAGAAGARGSAGMGGAPMGAAGRGQGDEDSEHQRKVLIEADPEATFGTDELVAPRVIGDPAYEDE